jgi:phage terminase large subunit
LKARFKGYSGPIGSGKSQALCHEAIRLAYRNPGRTGLIGAPTYPMLRDSTQLTFLEVLNTNGIPFDWNRSENTMVLADTGSRILFRAIEDFERLRGTNLAWFGVDELTYAPEEAWLRLEGRLRDPDASQLCGFAVWTPKGFDWVHRRFISSSGNGYEVVIAKPGENRFLLSAVPDFYERLKTSYDERFYKQEVLGEYLNVQQGQVYHSFDRKKHLFDAGLDKALPLLWTLDFNVDPQCSLVAQRVGRVAVVLDEIVLRRASTQEVCKEFQRRYLPHEAGVTVYGDSSGSHMQTAGTTDYQIIQEHLNQAGQRRVEFRYQNSNPLVRDRINSVNSALCSAAGEVRLYVSPRCKELIADLEQVVYKDGSGVIDKMSDPMRTHLSDALGYLLWQEFRERPTIGERSERLF